MEDGPYRARRPTGGRRHGPEDPQDVLARHGLLGSDLDAPPPGSRAARRLAAERGASPVTDSGRHSVDSPSGRHGAPPADGPRGGRRYRADEPGPASNGFHPGGPPARGGGGYEIPPGGGGRRRAPDPFEAPPPPANGGRRHLGAPDAGRRFAEDLDEPVAPPRRRRAEPFDDAAELRRQPPAQPSGRRYSADVPPAAPRGRRDEDAGLPPNGRARRYRPDPEDEPALPMAGPRRSAPPDATTALPGAGSRRRAADPDAWAPAADAPATTAIPTGGRTRRHRPDPLNAEIAADRDVRPPDADPPTTTAIPTGGRTRRHRPDPPAAEVAATTALPAAAARRTAATVGPPMTAPPGTRRRPAGDPPRSARAAEEPAATTALPVGAGRRSRADAPEPLAAAATTALRRRGGDPGHDATVAVPRSTGARDDAAASDRDLDARTRAMRIDETLTRLTAAHAGLTLAVTDRPAVEPSAPPPRRGPAATAMRLLAGALALVVLTGTAFGWGAKTWLGSAVRDAAALDPKSSAVVDAAAQAGDENVLVVAKAPAPADPAEPRADTVAVAHVPDGGGPVTVLAFPLDLEINRPPCETWDASTATYRNDPVQAEARTQLASALDLGGPRCITRVVQQLSGLAITKYVGLDLAAVPAMTDAVGGAEVCVPRPVLDGVLGPVVPDPGKNRLAGVRVADFVQAGDVEGEPSPEYGRIERQQSVLAAVLDSAVSGTALLDVGRLMALRPSLADAVLTDGAGLDQVLALAMTLRRLDADGVRYAAVPTAEHNSRGNAVLRDTDAAALFAAVRGDQPLPAEATGPGDGSAGPSPSEVTVDVVNASARSGLAGEVSETLSSLGFDVGEPVSADQPTSETVIRFSPDQAAAAELLRSTVPSATEVPDPGSTGVLQLVLGRSFDDVVRAPSEPIALAAPSADTPAAPAVTCT